MFCSVFDFSVDVAAGDFPALAEPSFVGSSAESGHVRFDRQTAALLRRSINGSRLALLLAFRQVGFE